MQAETRVFVKARVLRTRNGKLELQADDGQLIRIAPEHVVEPAITQAPAASVAAERPVQPPKSKRK